ncbi:MAG: recombinase family protein [Alphaproteobacteria bacterium]
MVKLIHRRPRYVAYYRVSTKRQGRSGLGLDAQEKAVADHIAGDGGEVVASFTEVETGKRADRPQLEAAMAECHVRHATLLVAKLDRLARNAHFLLGLKEAGIEFICCDMPSANRMTVGIMAVVAEEEAKVISDRTKAALAAAKARGVRLGSPGNLTAAGQAKGAQRGSLALQKDADLYAERMRPTLDALKADGITGNRPLARALNERGYPTRRGGTWTPTQVSRLLDRMGGVKVQITS